MTEEHTVPEIAPALQLLSMSIRKPKVHPHNPRRGDIPAIMASLKRFGQVKPIVIQESTSYIIAGNHTMQAAKKLGYKEIAVTVVDCDDDEAMAYLLADNRSSDRARYKNTELGEMLQEQMDLGNLEGTGYDMDDVEDALSRGGAEGANEGASGGAGGGPAPDGDDENPTGDHEGVKRVPIREVVMLMPQPTAIEFGKRIAVLQKHYGVNTVVDTVLAAVAEAAEAHPLPEAEPTEDGAEKPAAAKPKRARGKAKAAVDPAPEAA